MSVPILKHEFPRLQRPSSFLYTQELSANVIVIANSSWKCRNLSFIGGLRSFRNRKICDSDGLDINNKGQGSGGCDNRENSIIVCAGAGVGVGASPSANTNPNSESKSSADAVTYVDMGYSGGCHTHRPILNTVLTPTDYFTPPKTELTNTYFHCTSLPFYHRSRSHSNRPQQQYLPCLLTNITRLHCYSTLNKPLSFSQSLPKTMASSSKQFPVPSTFFETLTSTYEAAVKSGDLIFTPTSTQIESIDDINYVYSVIPTLKEKPNAIKEKAKKEVEEESKEKEVSDSKPFDPFDPPSPPLTVLPSYAEDYAVVLNKFAVVPRHFILITKKQEPQAAPLRPADLAAAFHLLRAANKQSSKRHIGFFNCGLNSGASVDHRHIQFLQLPDNFEPWPDHIAKKHRAQYKDGERPLVNSKTPFFSHFLVPIDTQDSELEIDDHLGFRYSTLLSRILTTLRNAAPIETSSSTGNQVSYNLVFTEEWMLAVPRTAPDFIDSDAGISLGINAVGVVGLLLAKGDGELNYIKEKGPIPIIQGVSLPSQDRNEDVDYDY